MRIRIRRRMTARTGMMMTMRRRRVMVMLEAFWVWNCHVMHLCIDRMAAIMLWLLGGTWRLEGDDGLFGFAVLCIPLPPAVPHGSRPLLPVDPLMVFPPSLTIDIAVWIALQIKSWVDDINANLDKLPTRGPHSKYDLTPELQFKGESSSCPPHQTRARLWGSALPCAVVGCLRGVSRKRLWMVALAGRLEVEFSEHFTSGVACSMESKGFAAIQEAWNEVYGACKPFSITGTLPCVRVRARVGAAVSVLDPVAVIFIVGCHSQVLMISVMVVPVTMAVVAVLHCCCC